ncbi:MAG: hypothetical protein L0Z53_15715 [Acidobacteriales bacterium]|nr:hypothetical protein [Terriglobales bacterium]
MKMISKSLRTRILVPWLITASIVPKLLTIGGIVAALLLGFQHQVRAQATVTMGEVELPGEFLFFTMPDDPLVTVSVTAVLEAVVIFDSGGGAHFLVKGVKEILTATVVGTSFDYELVSLDSPISPNNFNAKGGLAASASLTIELIRLDPVASLPVAVVLGKGHVALAITPDGNLAACVENIDWTVTPL